MRLALSGAAFSGAVVLAGRAGESRGGRCPVPGFQVLWSILALVWVVVDRFTGNGLDASVVFAMYRGPKGAGLLDFLLVFLEPVAVVVGGIAALNLVVWALHKSLQPAKLGEAAIQDVRTCSAARAGVASKVCAMAAIVLSPLTLDAFEAALTLDDAPSFGDNAYMCPLVPNLAGGVSLRRPNLVLVYAESFERSYLDPDVFGELMPSLRVLEHESVSFTNVESGYGATWSIAGKVASQCGAPFVLPSIWTMVRQMMPSVFGGSDDNHRPFLPGLYCIGDVLHGLGYDIAMFMGHDSGFHGEGDFARTHRATFVGDVTNIHSLLDPGASHPTNYWGFYDDDLFAATARHVHELQSERRRQESLSAAEHSSETSPRPFMVVLETMDMHNPDGHLSPSCARIGRRSFGRGGPPFLDAAHCFDALLANFVRDVRDNDTVVVVVSDHTSMPNAVWETLRQHPRRNSFFVFDDSLVPRFINTSATTLDVGATILDAMGLGDGVLGLGRSLLREPDATLRSLFSSIQELNRELRAWTRLPDVVRRAWHKRLPRERDADMVESRAPGFCS